MDQATLLRRMTGEQRLQQAFQLTDFVLKVSKRAKAAAKRVKRNQRK